MDLYALTPGTPLAVPVPPGARMLRVLNTPELDPNVGDSAGGDGGGSYPAGWVAVGFDRPPTLLGGGATPLTAQAIVPPGMDGLFRVPPFVQTVYLVIPTRTGVLSQPAPAGTPYRLWCEWYASELPPHLRPVDLAAYVANQNGNAGLVDWTDFTFNVWQGRAQTPVYDMQAWENYTAFLRPHVAPSLTETIHAALTASTLANFGGATPLTNPSGSAPGLTIKSLLLTYSVAATLVIGWAALTVGSPGANEWLRVGVTAGVPVVLPFAEGFAAVLGGTGGTHRVYATAAGTLDATVIGG